MHSTSQSKSESPQPGIWFVVLLGVVALVHFTGCAAQEKKPQTVTEWMQQPRVGEAAR
jgi:hypothetical protein